MSRCAHGTLLTKRCRNCAAVMLPASRPPPMFLTSAASLSIVAVVALGERQAPQLLADRLAGGDQPLGQLVVVGEQPGMLGGRARR